MIGLSEKAMKLKINTKSRQELRPPANYVNPVTLGSRKIQASRALDSFSEFKQHCTASRSATLAGSHAVTSEKFNLTCMKLIQCAGTSFIRTLCLYYVAHWIEGHHSHVILTWTIERSFLEWDRTQWMPKKRANRYLWSTDHTASHSRNTKIPQHPSFVTRRSLNPHEKVMVIAARQ